jgi:hypothetical protein
VRIALRVCVLIALSVSAARAQSPRAGGPAPGDDPTSRLGADLAITGNLARGFVDRELIAARGVVQAWQGGWGLYVQPYWLYGRVATPAGKLTTDNELYLRIGLFRTISDPFFVYAVNALDHSLRRKIDHRDLLGAGAGVNIRVTKGTSLLTSVGVLGEYANYGGAMFEEHPERTSSTRTTMRASLRVYGRYKIAGGKLSFTHDVYLIPSVTEPTEDYRIMLYGALDAPIAKGFGLRAQADATREGVIVVGTKHDDLQVTFGITYKNEWTSKKKVPPPPSPTPTPAPTKLPDRPVPPAGDAPRDPCAPGP